MTAATLPERNPTPMNPHTIEKGYRKKGLVFDMDSPQSGVSIRVAKAARELPLPRRLDVPCLVVVVVSSDTFVVTISGVSIASDHCRDGRLQGRSASHFFPAAYFSSSIELLRKEIDRITENRIIFSKLDVDKTTGSLVFTFTTGSVPDICVLDDIADGYSGIISEIAHQP